MPIFREDRNETRDAVTGQVTVEVVQVDITEEVNRAQVESDLASFLSGATTAIANMQAVKTVCDTIQADPAPTFANLAQALTQVTALQNRLKALSVEVEQIAATNEAHIRKTVALARYVSNQLDSLENT